MFEIKNLDIVHYIQYDGDSYRRKYIKYLDKVLWQKRVGEASTRLWAEPTEDHDPSPTVLEHKFQEYQDQNPEVVPTWKYK